MCDGYVRPMRAMACVTKYTSVSHYNHCPNIGEYFIWNMVIKVEAYKRSQMEMNTEKQQTMKLKHLNKKLHALQLSKEELEKLFAKHSFSVT